MIRVSKMIVAVIYTTLAVVKRKPDKDVQDSNPRQL